MDKIQASNIVKNTFEKPFDKTVFISFVKNLLNQIEETPFTYKGNYIHDSFKEYIASLERIGKYSDGEHKIDILIVQLKKETSIERARTMQRNYIAKYLNGSRGGEMKEAALVAFVSPNTEDWRFSLVKMDYKFEKTAKGKTKVKEEFTPARRWSFLVGTHENSHTAQSRLVPLISDDTHNPTLAELEESFNIEKVTKEFFEKYRELFLRTKEELDKVIKNDSFIKTDFEKKDVNTVDFSKKLLGQIVFLYFLQKKGWFGVQRDSEWGAGSKQFLRELFEKKHGSYNNFFNDILEPLFYEALRIDRSHDDHYYKHFNCKIPFLNGGLFDPMNGYDWVKTDILIPNELFSNSKKTKEGDTGDGILDIFDRYNFTVKEDEPLEKEVAIDPELLGKAYEKFNAIRPDNYAEFKKALKSGKKGDESKFNKQYGVYYTPREIVHYMCQQSLINYLYTELNDGIVTYEKLGDDQIDMFGNEGKTGQLDLTIEHNAKSITPKEDIETLLYYGEHVSENEEHVGKSGKETATYYYKIPDSIRNNAENIDVKLANIKVCDPAIGSGAFPVGMMSEIVRARNALTPFIKNKARSMYHFKRECIENSLYGVDIDPGAVEIAKLRLWLSLVVDEDDIKQIKPLPNLDYKIVCGNSLLGFPDSIAIYAGEKEIERLKNDYINETNPSKKNELKLKIDDAIITRFSNSYKTYGYEINFDFKTIFSEIFHQKNGFDIVIANPPYVQFQKLDIQLRNILRNHKYYESQSDLWYFFVYKGIEILRDKGLLIFIVSNYFLQAGHAETLRLFVTENTMIISIINFVNSHVFENVGVHNAILFLRKFIPRNYNFPYINCNDLSKLSANDNHTFNIHKSSLGKTWKLINNHETDLLNSLLTKGNNLGSFSRISNGIKSGDDSIFLISNINEDTIIEKNLLKNYLKNSEIHKYYTDKPQRKIIYSTSNIDLDSFPKFKEYVNQYKKTLTQKWSKRGEINDFWKLYRPREDIYNYNKDIIIVPYRTKSIGFSFNNKCLSGTDTYLILNTSKSIHDKTLLGLLNSKLINWIFIKIGKKKGDIFEIATKELSLLPIVFPTSQISNKIIKHVDNIHEEIRCDDFHINENKQAKVLKYEKEIDHIVYELYGLTKEDIEIVEGEK